MRPRFAVSLCALALTCSCGGSGTSRQASTSSGESESSGGGTITVLAAASLTEGFGTLKEKYEAAHPGASVRLSFGPSSGLAQQIIAGAPADVFASASGKNMKVVVDAGDAAKATNFVANKMVVVVPPKNPARISRLSDIAKPGVKVALCQPQVPCGATAGKVLAKARLTVRPATLEDDVKATLIKVELGEVDAGVVYVTDARAAGDKVRAVPIADTVNASTSYPIAPLTHAPNAAGARSFVDLVLSETGRAVLKADGFARP